MADSYGDNLGEKYAANTLKKFYETTIVDRITNKDYESVLADGKTELIKIKTFQDVTINTYSGSALSVETVGESECTFTPDQKKAYYFKIQSLTKFQDYVNDPSSELISKAGSQLKETIDAYVLSLYADAGSGNRVGTDYTTGTVEVTVTTGAVTGSGTTFTSGMAGLGFKATGHTAWYRIKTYTSATAIVIEDDSDDDTSAYTGGAISAGTAYTIEAATVLTVTTSNIFQYIDALALRLDEAKAPKPDRWCVIPAKIASVLRRSDEMTPAVESAYQDVIKKGLLGMAAGLEIYSNEQVSGNNTTGYYCMAGHKSAITFAMTFEESGIEDLIGDFGKAYKGLIVYGAKVADVRRRNLAYMWAKV